MGSKATILYIDDDILLLDVVRRYFERRGYAVIIAEDGKQGLQLCREHNPDVVLVDLNMPVMDGFTVIQNLSYEYPNIASIVLSGEGEMDSVIKALHAGAWHYLTKPIENYEIISHAIDQCLEKSALLKQSEAYQLGLEKKLWKIFERFPGFVMICDREMNVSYMNPSLVAYLGEDKIGGSCFSVFSNEDGASWWPEELSKSTVDHLEVQNPRDARWYDVTKLAIKDHHEEIAEYQIIMIDITKQKHEMIELQAQQAQLEDQHNRLLESLAERYRFGNIVGKSSAMQEVYRTIIRAGRSDASVIVYGESGTGKELVAQSIHDNSSRADKPFVCVNCGAIPENLIESEFFGYKKGAFSGADFDKSGYLDVANGGTIFLDEVGEIPLNMQTKLLRALEGGGYTPLGSTELKNPDVRVIAATNRDLKKLVRDGKLREDFFYRIHVIPIILPPLRERNGDIAILIEHFLEQFSPQKKVRMSPNMSRALEHYSWPGNVRELQNTIQRFLAIGKIDFMALEDPEALSKIECDLNFSYHDESLSASLDAVEKKILFACLEKFNWHQTRAAKALQIDRKTLYRKLKHHNIDR